MLETKWKSSVSQLENTKKAFEDLTNAVDDESKQEWAEEEQIALEEGGDALSVYGVRLQEGLYKIGISSHFVSDFHFSVAPSLAEIRLNLAEKEQANGIESGLTSWLANGLHIQESQ